MACGSALHPIPLRRQPWRRRGARRPPTARQTNRARDCCFRARGGAVRLRNGCAARSDPSRALARASCRCPDGARGSGRSGGAPTTLLNCNEGHASSAASGRRRRCLQKPKNRIRRARAAADVAAARRSKPRTLRRPSCRLRVQSHADLVVVPSVFPELCRLGGNCPARAGAVAQGALGRSLKCGAGEPARGAASKSQASSPRRRRWRAFANMWPNHNFSRGFALRIICAGARKHAHPPPEKPLGHARGASPKHTDERAPLIGSLQRPNVVCFSSDAFGSHLTGDSHHAQCRGLLQLNARWLSGRRSTTTPSSDCIPAEKRWRAHNARTSGPNLTWLRAPCAFAGPARFPRVEEFLREKKHPLRDSNPQSSD